MCQFSFSDAEKKLLALQQQIRALKIPVVIVLEGWCGAGTKRDNQRVLAEQRILAPSHQTKQHSFELRFKGTRGYQCFNSTLSKRPWRTFVRER